MGTHQRTKSTLVIFYYVIWDNTSFKQITNWVHRFEAEGIEGLRDKPGRGRHSNLDENQRDDFGALLKESPQKHGYNSATWTGPMLIDWIEKNYGITYKKAQIYNIIKSLGFAFQKDRGIFPETNLSDQEEFKSS
jgi:transposase